MNTRLIAIIFLASVSMSMQSCIEEPPGGDWQRPPRYGHGGTDTKRKPPMPQQNKKKPANRFGYSGDDPSGPPSDPGTSDPRDRDRDPGSSSSTGTDDKDKPAVEKPSGPPSAGSMPFAKGVPGKPLSVKVPGRESLGEVSIEQYDASGAPTGKPLPPGTPVSIPDPNNPGKEIYFKVP